MEYEIIRSARKTVSLSVKEGKLIVRSPYGTPTSRLSELVRENIKWIEKQLIKQSSPRIKDKQMTDDEIKALRKSARAVLTSKMEYFSGIMGLKYGRITITSAKTRFGSCNSDGNISFSYLLMLYPEEAIDYVVVHELAHLKEMNHSPAFYKIIAEVLPDYKSRLKLLKL